MISNIFSGFAFTGSSISMMMLLVKATLILLVALGVTLSMQRASAGARHLVWLVTLATLLLVPALTAWGPIPVRILPAATAAARIPALASDRIVPKTNATGSEKAKPNASAIAEPHATPAPAPSLEQEIASSPVLSGISIVVLLWAVVVLAIGASLGYAAMLVKRIVNRARPLDSEDWLTPLWEVSDRLSLEEPPRLLRSEDAKMPFACGLLKPTIVLPAECDNWSLDRRRAVLLHELAHVRRHDLIGHTLGRLACAVYWFHPLVWTAARQLRAESERACDDLVLACGARASDYVAHLLDIITSVKRAGAPVTALPMARKKEFEGRMLAILDPAIPRGAPGRLQSLSILAVLVLITLSVAAAAPARTPIEIASDSATPDPAQDLVLDAPKAMSLEPRQRPPREEPKSGVKVNQKVDENLGQLLTKQVDQVVKEATRIVNTADIQRAVMSATAPGKRNDPVALAQQSGDRVEALVKILRTDEDEEVRRSAAWGLAQMRDARVTPALTEAFRKDRDEHVREMAIWALAHLTDDAAVFVDALRQDPSEEVRETAAWALGNRDTHDGDAALITALRDDSPEVRRTAIWALGNIKPRQASTAIAPLLKDGDPEVRMMAAWALGQIVDRATAPELRAAFAVETDNEARQAEFRALAFMGDMSSEFIEEAMKSKDPELRAKAVRVLAGQGTGPWPWPWPWPRPRPSP